MIDTTLALQKAIIAALKSDDDVAGLIAGRIYDRAPATVLKPYITIGPADLIAADADCIASDEITQQLDAWSIEPGFSECKRICGAVRKALRRLQAEQDGLRFEIEHQSTRVFTDADGITSHGVITVRATIDTAGD